MGGRGQQAERGGKWCELDSTARGTREQSTRTRPHVGGQGAGGAYGYIKDATGRGHAGARE